MIAHKEYCKRKLPTKTEYIVSLFSPRRFSPSEMGLLPLALAAHRARSAGPAAAALGAPSRANGRGSNPGNLGARRRRGTRSRWRRAKIRGLQGGRLS